MIIALLRFLPAPVGPMAGFPTMLAISYTRGRFGWPLAFSFLVSVAVAEGFCLEDARADDGGIKGGGRTGSEE